MKRTRVITAEQLHDAADRVGHTEDPSELGFAKGALESFVEASVWWEGLPPHDRLQLDPLSLAVGVSIGAVAADSDDGR